MNAALKRRRVYTLAEIEAAVCKHFEIDIDMMRGARKEQRLSRARHVLYHLARNLTALSWVELAAYFGRDHTGLMYGHRQVAKSKLLQAHAFTVECALDLVGAPAATVTTYGARCGCAAPLSAWLWPGATFTAQESAPGMVPGGDVGACSSGFQDSPLVENATAGAGSLDGDEAAAS